MLKGSGIFLTGAAGARAQVLGPLTLLHCHSLFSTVGLELVCHCPSSFPPYLPSSLAPYLPPLHPWQQIGHFRSQGAFRTQYL